MGTMDREQKKLLEERLDMLREGVYLRLEATMHNLSVDGVALRLSRAKAEGYAEFHAHCFFAERAITADPPLSKEQFLAEMSQAYDDALEAQEDDEEEEEGLLDEEEEEPDAAEVLQAALDATTPPAQPAATLPAPSAEEAK